MVLLCLRQVTDTTYGQSAGAMTTPAIWAQVTWKEVVHSFSEHWMQAPRFWLAVLLWQKTHFCEAGRQTGEGFEGGNRALSVLGSDSWLLKW